MVAVGASFFSTIFSPVFHGEPRYQALKLKYGGILSNSIAPRFAMPVNRISEKQKERRSGWKEYLKQSKKLIKADGGAPRWFSPLECSSQGDNSPLMLFLPGQSLICYYE
ncbi:acyltransferase-like protein chloroplastic-like [Trifolium pratense]|uniref:Acyltransferase-like protein chloroplastic-like n=1 Tax=Trifolium pratense TaxID=57577 RepID=A0A2K3MZP3_TRIPR|nr:acyltransferase-like protein chloroplastic-like [Trifolium pratense]